MNFDRAADELHREEFSRLESARTPRIEAFRSMTCGGFRDEVAAMMERLNHALITLTPWLVTVKEGRKYVTACANPTDGAPIPMPAIRRLHDAVVVAGAFNGIYVTPRSFTPEAEYYAAHAPIKLVDGPLLIKSMQLSRKGLLLPRTYKAMCRQCGDIVQHSLVKDEPLPCANGHPVAPTISRASLVPYRPPAGAPQPAALNPAPVYALRPVGPHPAGAAPSVIKPRNMTAKSQRRRAIRMHNQRMRGRVMRQHQEQKTQCVIDQPD
jgi:hypothetical protein